MKQLQETHIEILAKELLYQSLRDGKKQFLKSEGSCMNPLMESGDEVFFKKTKDFRFADIVVYKKNASFLVHRFIRKLKIDNKDFFILKADNSWKTNEPVSVNEIIGVVTKLKHKDKIFALDTLPGKAKSIFCLMRASLNLIFSFQIEPGKKDAFREERQVLKLIALDKLKQEERKELLELLKNSLHWEYVAERIKWNFLTSFFIKKVKNLNLVGNVTKDSWETLENIHRLQLIHDTKSRQILNIVLNEFNNKDIKALLVKGAHLGIEVYEDTSQRWMGDIDLLVKAEDWFKAYEALIGLGFSPVGMSRDYNSWGIRYLDNHIDFYKQGTRLELKSDIWAIDFPYFNYSFWQRVRKTQIEKAQVYFPSYEDTLLIACVNVIRHNFTGLIWFLDIKKIIDKFGHLLDWQAFLERTELFDLKTVVYYSLYFTDKLFTLNLPQDLLPKLKPNPLAKTLFNFFWDKEVILLKKEGSSFKAKIPFECAFVLFCGKFSLRPKKLLRYIIYLLKIIFPPPNFIKDKYRVKIKPVQLLKCYLLRLFSSLSVVFSLIFKLFIKQNR